VAGFGVCERRRAGWCNRRIVWLFGGLKTSGRFLDWSVVTALATIIGASAAVGALASVAYGVEQLRQARRTERLSLMPYLRFDVGFVESSKRHPGFVPPTSRYMFDPEDFGEQVHLEGLDALRPGPNQDSGTLALWVTNQQTAPLGGAYDVQVGLYVEWRLPGGERRITHVDVDFAYVEAGKTTAMRFGKIRSDVEELVVHVFAVSYYGMFMDRELRNRHGALSLVYNPSGGVIQNDRSWGLSELP